MRSALMYRRFQAANERLTRHFTSQAGSPSWVEVGATRVRVRAPKRPDLVPRLAYGAALSKSRSHSDEETAGGRLSDALRASVLGSCPEVRSHIEFLLQKDQMEQDCMLLGPPGPLRRWVVLAYCSLTGREVEYVALSRDTGEGELKQRRELRTVGEFHNTKSAVFVDGPVIRAAREGRVLILDGIEKAERNILPLLNNLLENREMGLEDGTRLLGSDRFDEIVRPLCDARGLSGFSMDSPAVAQLARDQLGLVRVNEGFRVIALGLPVPQYPGNSLDPPLRSRFQGRYVGGASPLALSSLKNSLLDELPHDFDSGKPSEAMGRVSKFAQVMSAINEPDIDDAEVRHLAEGGSDRGDRVFEGGYESTASSGGKSWRDFRRGTHAKRHGSVASARATSSSFVKAPPQVPLSSLIAAGRTIAAFSDAPGSYVLSQDMFDSMYPINVLSDTPEHQELALDARKSYFSGDECLVRVENAPNRDGSAGLLRWSTTKNDGVLDLALDSASEKDFSGYVAITNSDAERVLASLALHLRVGGCAVMLLGPHGAGKMTLVRQASKLLGMPTEIITCFRDMSSRDLFQRRSTDELGNTIWVDSPLVRAAKQGSLAILQNIDRFSPGGLSPLSSLLQDEEAFLPDGSRLLAAHRYDDLCQSLLSDEELASGPAQVESLMAERFGIFRISPHFRVVATAAHVSVKEDPTLTSSATRNQREESKKAKWLSEELVNIFSRVLQLDSCRGDSLETLLQAKTNCSLPVAKLLSAVDFHLRTICGQEPEAARLLLGKKSSRNGVTSPLSTRQLVRIAGSAETVLDLRDCISRILMLHMMPKDGQEVIFRALNAAKVPKSRKTASKETKLPKVFWGSHAASRASQESALDTSLIPSVLFFDIPHHESHLRELADEFARNEHLLLIGGQGTGKNKLTDALCERLRLPRQYMQLHRDTTVGQLTSQIGVEEGKVVRKDSPLMIAAREGQVLVVDEADKAPLEVVAILRAVVDGEVALADGRKLVSGENVSSAELQSNDIVVMHPDFRLLVLANRPGFPFLGNDFFGECGDAFSPFLIDNPDLQSEIQLLRCYSPSVSDDVLRRVAGAFSSLRAAANRGELRYPYSTREAVSVAKHLEYLATSNSPLDEGERIAAALDSVLAFDAGNAETAAHLARVFSSHMLPVGGKLARNAWIHASAAASANKKDREAARALAVFLNKEMKAYKRGKLDETFPVRYTWESGTRSNLNLNMGDTSRLPWQSAPPLRADPTNPKHGRVDPSNSPHVGGNTWAGGTGGRDTAGLGGVGGPYRLDAGHDVHQLTEAEKRRFDENEAAKAAARKMGQEALARRLAAIEMDAGDAQFYAAARTRVAPQVAQLRQVIDEMETRMRERQWYRNQLDGEMDDQKIVESLVGEEGIFKRRMPVPRGDTEFYSKNETDRDGQKKIHFVVDVSGSMYRFNGYDGRLNRLLDSTLLLLEGLEGHEDKVSFAITGHSGDSPDIPFVKWGSPPRNEKERFRVLQLMAAHAQHCWSGDHTIMAFRQAVDKLHKDDENEGGDKLVVLLSDANLDRYGITPSSMKRVLQKHDDVKACVFFIGSLYDQAASLVQALPAGTAFACEDTSELPSLMRKVVETNLE